MINQKNREDLIKRLDKSEESVMLEDLFLYDLSPYYYEKESDSFFSKQLEYIQEKNQLEHNPKISFTSEQIRIYNKLVDNNRSIVSAPTSFGKTMLIKEYIFNYEPNKVVFIVPTNALADELLDDFKKIYEKKGYTIFDSVKSLAAIDDKTIFIGTQEKYYNLIELYEDIDLFVIDEAYKLTDPINGSREVILNRAFIDTLENSEKIILLMPLVNSITGLERLNFITLKSDYAPIAKAFESVKELDQTIIKSITNNDQTNLIYFNSPKKLEEFYLNKLKSFASTTVLSDKWIKRVEDDFHPSWLPIMALKSGVGIHYGPMPKFIQNKVITLFKTKAIRSVLATNSIIEGVNTPIKNIYIYESRSILGKNNLVKFKNLIGRAGRLGKHKVGNIFYWERHQKQFKEANVHYKDIDIQLIIENDIEIIQINRDSIFSEDNNRSLRPDEDNIQSFINNSNYSSVPHDEIVKLLNKYGFTVGVFKTLLEYIELKKNERARVFFLGIIGKIFPRVIEADFLNIVLNQRYTSFEMMTNQLSEIKTDMNISQIVSSIIDIIYNIIPFKIIPLINFTLDINSLYMNYNESNLLPLDVLNDAKSIKAKFYLKFLGDAEQNEELLVVINKLFEYGVPYHRAKPFLSYIANKLPNKFSIHDIKKIIMGNDSMKDLQVYFE